MHKVLRVRTAPWLGWVSVCLCLCQGGGVGAVRVCQCGRSGWDPTAAQKPSTAQSHRPSLLIWDTTRNRLPPQGKTHNTVCPRQNDEHCKQTFSPHSTLSVCFSESLSCWSRMWNYAALAPGENLLLGQWQGTEIQSNIQMTLLENHANPDGRRVFLYLKSRLESSRRGESLNLIVVNWITEWKKIICWTVTNLGLDKRKEPSRTWGLIRSCGKRDWLLSQLSQRPVRLQDLLLCISNGRLTTFIKHLNLLGY